VTATVALAFLHHAAAFLIVGVLTAELVLLKGELTLVCARSVLRMDAAYGIAAAVLLVVGLLRVFYTEKGSAYYFHSGPFIVKLTLFLIVGLLSIYPTLQFLSWRGALRAGRLPAFGAGVRRRVRIVVHIDLTLLFVIMLCAAMMARAIGLFG
jgi:putative membrane protein